MKSKRAIPAPVQPVVMRTLGKYYFGNPIIIECDGNCSHAWGINWHKSKKKIAPTDSGTYEGGHTKPSPPYPPSEHNKWCVRECERCIILDA